MLIVLTESGRKFADFTSQISQRPEKKYNTGFVAVNLLNHAPPQKPLTDVQCYHISIQLDPFFFIVSSQNPSLQSWLALLCAELCVQLSCCVCTRGK
ncbi:hypothetical protein EYC84_003384 [Monilinia fructicola]|uniref:Uncharacterized protein n=1 Tax=Monilinia fructicola TaxID=38448 RepID=A0A5M9JTG3_MONFR|nr:hypothetical protein EYC84_003384 [Monilinia fructicola]